MYWLSRSSLVSCLLHWIAININWIWPYCSWEETHKLGCRLTSLFFHVKYWKFPSWHISDASFLAQNSTSMTKSNQLLLALQLSKTTALFLFHFLFSLDVGLKSWLFGVVSTFNSCNFSLATVCFSPSNIMLHSFLFWDLLAKIELIVALEFLSDLKLNIQIYNNHKWISFSTCRTIKM